MRNSFFIMAHPFEAKLLAATAIRYHDFHKASTVARDLAKNNLGITFYVLHAIESCRAKIDVVTTSETDNVDIPKDTSGDTIKLSGTLADIPTK